MIFDETMHMLEDAYWLRERSTKALLDASELREVVFTYMMLYAFEADPRNKTLFYPTMLQIQNSYPQGWPAGRYGITEAMFVVEEEKGRERNPFADHSRYSFEVVQRGVSRAT